jgi:soluble lytic murein transglycosylase-like protein
LALTASALLLGGCAELRLAEPSLAAVKPAFDAGDVHRSQVAALVDAEAPLLSPQQRSEIVEILLQVEQEHGLDAFLLAGLIQQESSWNPRAVSRTGALGLMQLFPAAGRDTADQLGIPWLGRKSLLDPVTNVRLGTGYLASMDQLFDGLPLALAAYNVGPGCVQKTLARGRKPGLAFANRVLSRRDDLRRRYGPEAFALAASAAHYAER